MSTGKNFNRCIASAQFGIVGAVNRANIDGAAIQSWVRTGVGLHQVNLTKNYARPEQRIVAQAYGSSMGAAIIPDGAILTRIAIETRTYAGVLTDTGCDFFLFQGSPTGGLFPLGPV